MDKTDDVWETDKEKKHGDYTPLDIVVSVRRSYRSVARTGNVEYY